jgi:hypothetical protein
MAAGLAGAPFTRVHAADAFEVGIKKWYLMQYKMMSDKALYPLIANVDSAEKQTVTDGVMAALGLVPQKAEGANFEYDAMQEAWTKGYTARTFALGVSQTEEAAEDELYGLTKRAGEALGNAMAYSKEVHFWALLNSLTATVYTAGGTNYTMFNSSGHYRVDGGVFTNYLSTGAGFSIEALELILSEWYVQQVDQRGLMQQIEPMWVVHGPSDRYVVQRVLTSIQQPQGNDNDPNAVRAMHNLKPLCVPYLTNDGRWFLWAGKEDTGVKFYNRVGSQIRRFDTQENGNTNIVIRSRFESGATHASGTMQGSAGS